MSRKAKAKRVEKVANDVAHVSDVAEVADVADVLHAELPDATPDESGVQPKVERIPVDEEDIRFTAR